MSLNNLSRFFRMFLFVSLFLAGFGNSVFGQRVALSTDAVDWAVGSANIGFDARLSRKVTLGVNVAGNPIRSMFGRSNLRLANFRIQPEVRYWFSRPMARHFVGINAMGGIMDIILQNSHYKGDIFGIGARYGFALVMNKRWNVEFSGGIGLGVVHGYEYKAYEPKPDQTNLKKVIPLPDLSVTFTYILK